MAVFKVTGDFHNLENFLKNASKLDRKKVLTRYAQEGVNSLSSATPEDSGLTARSWGYEIQDSPERSSITWTNSNVVDGVPIAIILQYGHGTRNGGYVQGRDYINPALKDVFDRLADDMWKEVTNL